MLGYRITLELSDGTSLEFTVYAKCMYDAKKFGIQTGKQMLKQKGLNATVKHIEAEEYYD